MKQLFALVCFCSAIFCTFVQASTHFTQKQVKQDLKILRDSVVSSHIDAFAYISEESFEKVYQQLFHSLEQHAYSHRETVSLYQHLVSSLNNGHTEIDFPVNSYIQYAQSGGTVFPLEIAFEHNKPLVRKNFSDNPEIKTGSEILSINGQSFADVMARIYPLVSAERIYLKHAKIEVYSFPRYYWQAFGPQEKFNLTVKQNKKIKHYALRAIDILTGYESKRDEVLNASMQLRFYGKNAYLNPGNFSGDEHKYQTFIDNAFAQINKRHADTLIIDLRNNGGGNNSFSDYLVAYLADTPFKWNSQFFLKSSPLLKADTIANRDLTDEYWQSVLRHDNGRIYPYDFGYTEPQPSEKRFNGNTYVLINRQSHSQAAVTAAQIQDYGWATIVGEETGDYPSLYASQFYFSLPNTGITVKISKGRIVRVNGSQNEEGVIPDIFIKDHLIDENDEILQGLLDKISATSVHAP